MSGVLVYCKKEGFGTGKMKESMGKQYMFTNRDLLRLIIPLVIEQFLTIIVGMADTIMVASVGEAAVSGISLVDSVNVLLIQMFGALATGGAVVVGRFIGSREPVKGRQAADQLVKLMACISLGIMVLIYLIRPFILNVVFGHLEPDVYGHANTYLLIVSASIPFIALYNAGAALFRSMGNSRISMLVSVLMNAVNIIGNAILIYGVKMGVAGAAIPTLVSRVIAAAVILVLLRNRERLIYITNPVKEPFQKDMVRRILNIGIPNGLENSMFQLGKIMVLSLVAGFGTASIAANAVSNTIVQFQVLPGLAMGLAIVTVVSQCVGAGDWEQVRYYTKKILLIITAALVAINALIYAGLPWILKAYNLSPETAAMTRQIVVFHGVMCLVIWPLSFSITNTLRAAGDVKFCMIVAIASMWIFRIGFSYILGKFAGLGVFGVWIAMIIDWIVRAVIFVWRYLGTKWMHGASQKA